MSKRKHNEIEHEGAIGEQEVTEGSGAVKRNQTSALQDETAVDRDNPRTTDEENDAFAQLVDASHLASIEASKTLEKPKLPPELARLRPVLAAITTSFQKLSEALVDADQRKTSSDKDRFPFVLLLLGTTTFVNEKLCSTQMDLFKALVSPPVPNMDSKLGEFEARFKETMAKFDIETSRWVQHLSKRPEVAGTAYANLITLSQSELSDLASNLRLDPQQSLQSSPSETTPESAWKSPQVTFASLGEKLSDVKTENDQLQGDGSLLERDSATQKEIDVLFTRASAMLNASRDIQALLHTHRHYHMDVRNVYHRLVVTLFLRLSSLLSRLNGLLVTCINYEEYSPTSKGVADFHDWYAMCLEAIRQWSEQARENDSTSTLYPLAQSTRTILCDLVLDLCTYRGQLNIGFEEMALLNELTGTLVEQLQARVTSKRIDFPWKRYTMGDPLEKLRNLQLKAWYPHDVRTDKFTVLGLQTRAPGFFPMTYQGPFDASPSYFAFDSPGHDYHNIDIITDYFQEKERMKGRLKNADYSPMEFWQKSGNAASLFRDALLNNPHQLLARDVRELIYKRVKECTQFKVTLAKEVIEKLNGTRMLDFSAGWGDRLVGAIGTSSIQRYVGVDPNLDLKPGHDEIIRTLAPTRQSAFTIIYEPFQTATLPQGELFDLVFTSPPYFDFEIYTQRPGQSVLEFPRFDGWLINFLLVSLRKAWGVLQLGGHLAVHITDTRDAKCCEIMNLFIQSRLPNSVYEGILGSYGQRKDVVRPIWVWRKEANPTEAQTRRRVEAEQFGLQHYPQIWRLLGSVFGTFSPNI